MLNHTNILCALATLLNVPTGQVRTQFKLFHKVIYLLSIPENVAVLFASCGLRLKFIL